MKKSGSLILPVMDVAVREGAIYLNMTGHRQSPGKVRQQTQRKRKCGRVLAAVSGVLAGAAAGVLIGWNLKTIDI